MREPEFQRGVTHDVAISAGDGDDRYLASLYTGVHSRVFVWQLAAEAVTNGAQVSIKVHSIGDNGQPAHRIERLVSAD